MPNDITTLESDGAPERHHSAEGGRRYDIVVMAASAGGLQALRTILSELSTHFPIPIVIVQHLAPHHRSALAEILGKHSALTIKQAEDGESIQDGFVYIAPPDNHLVFSQKGTVSLSHAAAVRFLRPSCDLLLESAAERYSGRVIAAVLTGTGKDGSRGVAALKKTGGFVIAQDKETSQFFGMPGAVIDSGNVDLVLPLEDIASVLEKLAVEETE